MTIRSLPGEARARGPLASIALEPAAARSSSVPSEDRATSAAGSRASLDRLAQAHYDFVWRTVRRLGLADAEVDDVVQEVFLVAARHIATIENERGFLFRTCQFVCSHTRRAVQRRREVADDELLEAVVDRRANPEESAAQAQTRQQLQELLDELPFDLRAVFVLFELERLTTVEIAEMLDLPSGTVASRLRRARELFTAAARKKGLV